jgi:hypothetical protein
LCGAIFAALTPIALLLGSPALALGALFTLAVPRNCVVCSVAATPSQELPSEMLLLRNTTTLTVVPGSTLLVMLPPQRMKAGVRCMMLVPTDALTPREPAPRVLWGAVH